ncbi:uncharacterized protein LOC110987564 isoform X2 [Acanthaster planci]|nr:uncharacterized protein LOC110987564 isoform X2 [Acanthaster planci]
MEQNAVTRRADSDLQRMRNVEVHQHSEVCVPTSVVPILPVEPTLSLPEVSINYQDSTISSHAKSCDFSTLRKSRLKCSKRNNGRNLKSREQFHGKRSQHFTEEDRCYLPPSKQFISEEKMAARMSHLSITNENTMASLQERWLQAKLKTKRQLEEIERRLSDSESDNDDDSNSDTRDGKPRQIQVSPELKMAMEKQEPLLPDSVVKSIANVCTELVLWKPPSSYISGTFNLSPNLDLVSTDKSDVPSSNNMKPSGSEASGLPSASIPKKQSDDTSHKCSFTDIVYGEISPSWTSVPDEFFDGVDDNMEF